MADPTSAHSAPHDPDVEHLLEPGPQLIIRLGAVIRTGRTHDVTNQAFQRQLSECLAVIHQLLEHEHEIASPRW